MKLQFLDLAVFHATKLVIHICSFSFRYLLQDIQQRCKICRFLSPFLAQLFLSSFARFLVLFSAWSITGIFAPSLKWNFAPYTCSSGRALQLPESHVSKADTRGINILVLPLWLFLFWLGREQTLDITKHIPELKENR